MPQFVYTMKGLGKVHPPDKQVLEDIWLSFLPGAKIGVLGLNGAGKSSLLKIMAGEDAELHRRGVPRRRAVGRLPAPGAAARRVQDRARATSKRASRRLKALLARYDEVNAQARRGPVARGDGQGARRAGAHPGPDRRHQRVGPRLAARAGDGRAAAAAARRRRHDAVGRRAPPRRALPPAAAVARPAAARRADQPPRRRVGRLARALPQGLRGHRRRRDARPLLPRQRRRLDPRARSRPRAFRGRATTRRGSSRSRSGWRSRRRPRAAGSGRSSASWSGSACRRAHGRPRARRA